MKRILVVVLLTLLPISSVAQTSTAKLAWDQPNATLAVVQGYSWTLKVDTGAAAIVTATCVAGTPVSCTTPLPAMTSGPHTVTLTAINAFGSASGTLNGAPPAAPINISVTVTVTVP